MDKYESVGGYYKAIKHIKDKKNFSIKSGMDDVSTQMIVVNLIVVNLLLYTS